MKQKKARATHDDTRVNDLCNLLEEYLDSEQVAEVYQAYICSADAHQGQTRLSGEAYIYHPVAVARILGEMRMDHKSIVAAILHDVIEDTGITKSDLAKIFDAEIAELVDGVTKLTQIKFKSHAEAQAENFRKMMLAMVRDIRVIIIKLADRLHNMRTLGVLRPEKRRRVARETLDIYVPIALRLGMNNIRHELEDLGFAALYPMRYRVLAEAVKRSRGNRKEIMLQIETSLLQRLEQEGVTGSVVGREKHLYSIFQKMRYKGMSFNEVLDVYAFRIVVDTVDTSYRVLGIIHNLYKPVPGRFKDYIAIPKANGYQSLHTVTHGPFDLPIEVQIRTADMDRVAEAGIAAHWLYKAGDGHSATQTRAREWLRELLEMQKSAGDSMEFLENVKIDLFPDEVYVFTPQGEIRVLPKGATAVDFAYAVHTDVGNACVAVKIDRRLAPLRSELVNGQTVEVITSPVTRPNPAWLNFVVTAKARTNIRSYLKHLQRDEAIDLGRRMVDKALIAHHSSLDALGEEPILAVVSDLGAESSDHIFESVGLGQHMAQLIAKRLLDHGEDTGEVESSAPSGDAIPLAIKDTRGLLINFAKCCHPIPGDSILGFITAGRGIVIHLDNCKNVAEFRGMPEKWIDVEWVDVPEGDFNVEIRIEVDNQRGVLATIAAEIAETGSNIENVGMAERDGLHSTLNFSIGVHDRVHLARIMRRIRGIEQVLRISRVRH